MMGSMIKLDLSTARDLTKHLYKDLFNFKRYTSYTDMFEVVKAFVGKDILVTTDGFTTSDYRCRDIAAALIQESSLYGQKYYRKEDALTNKIYLFLKDRR